MRLLVLSSLTFLGLVAGAARGLAVYSERHYLPQQQMDRAEATGEGCFLFLGDSRMVAALDAQALHAALQAVGTDRCHVELAIGATDVGGMYLTAREYLLRGHLPRAAVIGKVGDSLLGPAALMRPEEMVGNNAIYLTWSEPSDVYAAVPGFPLASIGTFDDGFRFLAGRATSLGRYQSLVSARIQQLQTALVGRNRTPQNRFGALGDMAFLEDGLRARAPTRLAEAMRGSEADRYGRWFRQLADLLRGIHVPMMIVELPMHRVYRANVTDSAQARAYQSWLTEQLDLKGDSLLDLSGAAWVDDNLFVDELHIGSSGAKLVSTEIGRYLGAKFERADR